MIAPGWPQACPGIGTLPDEPRQGFNSLASGLPPRGAFFGCGGEEGGELFVEGEEVFDALARHGVTALRVVGIEINGLGAVRALEYLQGRLQVRPNAHRRTFLPKA